MAMNNLVSVIIPVYKNIHFLKDAIKSVINQTYKNIEIIVVSDGNPNLEKINKIIKSFKNKIILINIKKNSGVSVALNLGIKLSKGRYVNWLSHDDYFHEKKIEQQIKILIRNKKLICFTNFCLINKNKKLIKKINIKSNFFNLRQNIFFRDNLNLSSALIDKAVFNKVGKFNIYKKHTQDYDYMFRMFKKYKPILLEKYYFFSRTHDRQSSKLDSSNAKREKETLVKSIEPQILFYYFKSSLIKKFYIVFFLSKRNLKTTNLILKKILIKENFFLKNLLYILIYVSKIAL